MIDEALSGRGMETAGQESGSVHQSVDADAPDLITATAPKDSQDKWFYDDLLPGAGDKPEWLKDSKYKSVTEQAKAYLELEKKFGAFTGAPDEYDLSLAENPEFQFSLADPAVKGFVELAKANGVNQGFFSEMLNMYAHSLQAQSVDTDAEFKKLGPNGKQDVQIIANWAENNFTPDEMGVFKDMMKTAEHVKLFDKVRRLATQPDIAINSRNQPRETKSQVLKDLSNPLYDERSSAGDHYRSSIRERLANAMDDQPRR